MARDEPVREGRADGASDRTLTIVIPAFNEAQRLPPLLHALDREADALSARCGLRLVEVMVVDDGSTDATSRLAEGHQGLGGRLRTIRFPANRGKGAAVRAGALAANGDLLLVSDVDLSTPLEELVSLVGAVDAGADVAIGSRGLRNSTILVHQPVYREFMGKCFNWALRLLTGLPYRDTQCGFKLFRLDRARVLFEQQRIEGFAFDAELCVLARQLGVGVVEVSVRWAHDPETHVGLVGSSTRMGLDLIRIAWLARRPRRAASGRRIRGG